MKERNVIPIVMWLLAVMFYVFQFVIKSPIPSVLNGDFMSHFSLTALGVSGFISVYYIFYTIMQIPCGILLDKYGTRIVSTCAMALCSIGLLIFIVTQNPSVAMIGQAFMGIGSSFSFILILKISSQWFHGEKVAMLSALATSIGVLGPIFGGPIIEACRQIFDWRAIIFTIACVGIVIAIVMYVVIRDNHKHDSNAPYRIRYAISEIFKQPQIFIIALFSMLMYSTVITIADLWGLSYIAKLYNISQLEASMTSNIIYIGTAIGSPIFAYMVAKYKSYILPLRIGAIGLAVTLFFVVRVDVSLTMMCVLLFILGVMVSSQVIAFSAAISVAPTNISATVSSVVNAITSVAGITIQPKVASIITSGWDGMIRDGIPSYTIENFRNGLSFILLMITISIGVTFFIKNTYKRN